MFRIYSLKITEFVYSYKKILKFVMLILRFFKYHILMIKITH